MGYKWTVNGHEPRKECWIFIEKILRSQTPEFGLEPIMSRGSLKFL